MREDLEKETELCISSLILNHNAPAFNSKQEICWLLEKDMEMCQAELNIAGPHAVELNKGLLMCCSWSVKWLRGSLSDKMEFRLGACSKLVRL
jgi:hypothetical protein